MPWDLRCGACTGTRPSWPSSPVVKGPVRISFRLRVRESGERLACSSWSISAPVYGEGLRREAAVRNADPGAPHRQEVVELVARTCASELRNTLLCSARLCNSIST